MRPEEESFVSDALEAARRSVEGGEGLKGTDFWKAVRMLRADPAAADRYADLVGRIDRRAFENGVRLRVPLGTGLAVLLGGTAVGFAAVGVAYMLDGLLQAFVLLGGVGALLVSTHSLAHWVVGRAVGMRFTHVFLGGPPPPRPGVKTDYATYLRTPPRARAWMHASGAIVTKLVPFALIPAAFAMDADTWVVWVLVGLGVLQILTDVFLSTRVSDWMKFRREMRAAKG